MMLLESESPVRVAPGLRPSFMTVGFIRKFVWMIGLVPMTAGLSFISAWAVDAFVPGVTTNTTQRFFLGAFSFLWVLGALLVWRTVIVWTGRRAVLTSLISLVPFVQVAVAMPMWTGSGCLRELDDAILQVGQHQTSIGLWTWLAVWVWWGWEKKEMAKQPESPRHGRPLGRLGIRMVAGISVIPLAIGFFLVLDVAWSDFVGSGPLAEVAVMGISAAASGMAWMLIWHPLVAWTRTIAFRTLISFVALVGIPLGVQVFQTQCFPGSSWSGVIVAMTIAGWGLWLPLSVRAWSLIGVGGSASETGPHCLKCHYSLIGLRATRCPECGDEPTLDELWESNPQKATDDIA